MLSITKELCALNGVTGCEDEVAEYIINRITPHVDEIKVDPLGSIIAYKKGTIDPPEKIMFFSHMDEIGFIVKRITDDGYIKFGIVGMNTDPRAVIGKRVLIGENRVPGVIGIKAIHLTTADERKIMPKVQEMYIDIGAETKENALKLVSYGDYIVFDSQPEDFGEGLIKARALDGRAGCAALIKLIEEGPDVSAVYVFAAQDEVGFRSSTGGGPAAFNAEAEVAIVVDGVIAADLPGVSAYDRVCEVGKGAVVPFMNGAIYDKNLVALIQRLADENGITWQEQTVPSPGGMLSKTIEKTRTGVKVCGISVPVRYPRTGASLAAVSDIEAVYDLASEVLKTFGGK